MYTHSAFCRRCRHRVYVLPRRHSRAGDRMLLVVTLGVWRWMQDWMPARYGFWQCDECGSTRTVRPRRVRRKSRRFSASEPRQPVNADA